MAPKKRNTEFVTVAVSEAAREDLRSATAWVIGLAGMKLSAGDAMRAMLRVARRHPEEVRAEVARQGGKAGTPPLRRCEKDNKEARS